MSTKVIATVACVALAAAVGIPTALAAVGANGSADNQTVDDGSQVLTFSTPYYVVEVPTDRSPYITFEYNEGVSADKVGVDKNPLCNPQYALAAIRHNERNLRTDDLRVVHCRRR